MSLYPEVLGSVRNACSQYRQRIIGIEELHVGGAASRGRCTRRMKNVSFGNSKKSRKRLGVDSVYNKRGKCIPRIHEGCVPS